MKINMGTLEGNYICKTNESTKPEMRFLWCI